MCMHIHLHEPRAITKRPRRSWVSHSTLDVGSGPGSVKQPAAVQCSFRGWHPARLDPPKSHGSTLVNALDGCMKLDSFTEVVSAGPRARARGPPRPAPSPRPLRPFNCPSWALNLPPCALCVLCACGPLSHPAARAACAARATRGVDAPCIVHRAGGPAGLQQGQSPASSRARASSCSRVSLQFRDSQTQARVNYSVGATPVALRVRYQLVKILPRNHAPSMTTISDSSPKCLTHVEFSKSCKLPFFPPRIFCLFAFCVSP